MFNLSWSEILILVVVALVFIGPKDLPKALHAAGSVLRYIRQLGGEFQLHLDEFMKKADLDPTLPDFSDSSRWKPNEPPAENAAPQHEWRSGTVSPEGDSKEAEEKTEAERAAEIARRNAALAGLPPFFPPKTMLRLVEERKHFDRPSIFPPDMAIHNGRRVRILAESIEKHGKREEME